MSSLTILDQTINVVNGFFSLNDLHRASGNENKHKPSYFMTNQETQEMIAELEKENMVAYHTKQGSKGGTYACRELVYRYAMWISPKFSLMVIRAFDAMNTGAIPCLTRHTISVEQQAQIRQAVAKRCKSNSTHYQTVYTALHAKFGIPRYDALLAADFDDAMDFIHDYQFAPVVDGFTRHIIADTNAHAVHTQASIDEIIQHLHPILEHLDRIKGRAITQQRLLNAVKS